MTTQDISKKSKKSDVQSKNFRLSGDVLHKALRARTSKSDIRSLYFIINYFDDLMCEYIDSILKKYNKEELLQLRDHGVYTDYFDSAKPTLSPKKFISFALAKFNYENANTSSKLSTLRIKTVDGILQNYDEFLESITDNECLGLLILLVDI